MTALEVWERQPGESGKAYAAFMIYREMPPFHRTLKRVCEALYGRGTANLRQVERWSSQWRWIQRGDAWDAHKDRAAQIESIGEAEAYVRTLRAARVDAAELLSRSLSHLLAAVEAGRQTLSVREVGIVAVIVQRLGRMVGQPDAQEQDINELLAGLPPAQPGMGGSR